MMAASDLGPPPPPALSPASAVDPDHLHEWGHPEPGGPLACTLCGVPWPGAAFPDTPAHGYQLPEWMRV